MYNSDYFNSLPDEEKIKWTARASYLRLKNICSSQLTDDDLGACIWYGESEFRKLQQNPSHIIEQLAERIGLHKWVVEMKSECILRKLHDKAG